MNRNKLSIIHLAIQRLLLYATLLLVWYYCYPDTLQHFEEIDFWTDTPDMTHVLFQWPSDWAAIGSCYLLQFFQYRFWAATLLALFPLLALLATDLLLWRGFRNCRLLWISFIPALFVAWHQTANDTLEPAIRQIVILWVAAVVVSLLTLRRPLLRFNRWPRLLGWLNTLVPYALIVILSVSIARSKERRQTENTFRIEHLTAQKRWAEVLNMTYPKRNKLSDNEMSYSLLALSREGQLAEKLFTYPVKGPENVFSHRENYRFNSYFCHELGLPNEGIRYAFEEGQYMPAGTSFGSIRRMVDWLLEKGDDPELVEYYLNLLSHSSCHDAFIRTRRIMLGQTPLKKRQSEPVFVGSGLFVYEAAVAFDNDPANTRAGDYMLCGLLMMGNLEAFYTLFQQNYFQHGTDQLPRHYREALAMLKSAHPEINAEYALDPQLEIAYANFRQLMRQGMRKEALQQYNQTLWGYLLRREEARKANSPSVDGQTGASTQPLGPEFGN